jgi:hypothetical protein
MTIDERIEALTQSVELLAGMQIATEKRHAELASTLNQFMLLATKIFASHEERLDKLEGS